MFAMAAFRDTFFAYTLRLAFGSRIFPHPDERELPAAWQSKRRTETTPRDSVPLSLNDNLSRDVRSIVSETTITANTPAKADPEKGPDSLLVDWYGPTDPDVSIDLYFYKCNVSHIAALESAELVELEEGMGLIPDVSSDSRSVPWLCHLHRWHTWYHLRVPCQRRRCACRPNNLCGWLWAWSVPQTNVPDILRFMTQKSL
jgi:hypothetical protein